MSDRRTPTWADDSELHDEYGYGQQQGQAQGHPQGQQQQGQQQYADNGYPQQNQQYQQSGQQQQHQQQQQYGHGNQQQYAPTDEDQRRYAQQESLRQYAQQAQTRPRVQPTYPPYQEQAHQGGYVTETGSWRFDVHDRTSSYTDQQAYDTYAPYDPYASYTAVEPEAVAEPVAPEPEKPGYTLPPVQESAWAVDTRRSRLLGRGGAAVRHARAGRLVPAAERDGLPGRGALHRVRPLRTGQPAARHQAAGGLRGLLLRASQAVPGDRGRRGQPVRPDRRTPAQSAVHAGRHRAALLAHPASVQPACRARGRRAVLGAPVDDGARQLRHLRRRRRVPARAVRLGGGAYRPDERRGRAARGAAGRTGLRREVRRPACICRPLWFWR
ncbi:hypothetical protein QFZ24_005894 [Streptomyces phaeochromogenes]|nr:hypothetical protein [Streptomyces phaeochromogenes]